VAVSQQADVEQQGVAPRPAPLSAGARQSSPSVALRQREPTPAPSCARARAQRAHGSGSPRLPPPSPPRVPRGPSARRDAASAPAERAKRDEDTALAKAYLRRVREEVDTPARGGRAGRQPSRSPSHFYMLRPSTGKLEKWPSRPPGMPSFRVGPRRPTSLVRPASPTTAAPPSPPPSPSASAERSGDERRGAGPARRRRKRHHEASQRGTRPSSAPRGAGPSPARRPRARERSVARAEARRAPAVRRGRKHRQPGQGKQPLDLRSAGARSRRRESPSPLREAPSDEPPPPRQRTYRDAAPQAGAPAPDPVPGLRMLCSRHSKWRRAALMVLGPDGDMHCVPPHTCRQGPMAAVRQYTAEAPLGLQPKAPPMPPPPPPAQRPPAAQPPQVADEVPAGALAPAADAAGRDDDLEADYGDSDPSL